MNSSPFPNIYLYLHKYITIYLFLPSYPQEYTLLKYIHQNLPHIWAFPGWTILSPMQINLHYLTLFPSF